MQTNSGYIDHRTAQQLNAASSHYQQDQAQEEDTSCPGKCKNCLTSVGTSLVIFFHGIFVIVGIISNASGRKGWKPADSPTWFILFYALELAFLTISWICANMGQERYPRLYTVLSYVFLGQVCLNALALIGVWIGLVMSIQDYQETCEKRCLSQGQVIAFAGIPAVIFVGYWVCAVGLFIFIKNDESFNSQQQQSNEERN